jgi:hypothetical protein
MTEPEYNPNAVRELNEKIGSELPHSQQEWKKAKKNTNTPLDKKRGSESLRAIREELNKR